MISLLIFLLCSFREGNFMSVGSVSFFVIVLFVIHEFEEIIRVYPWIRDNQAKPQYAKDTWISRKDEYPSTEAIASMILEEILLLSLFLFFAIIINSMTIVIAIAIINSLHLIMHLAFAIRIKSWNPGSVTALITLILNAVLISLVASRGIDYIVLLVSVLLLGAIFVLNLKLLQRHASRKSKPSMLS